MVTKCDNFETYRNIQSFCCLTGTNIVCACSSHFSCVQFFVTLWTIAPQASLSMEFSREEYWSGLPCPPPGDIPVSGIKPMSLASLALQADSSPLSQGKPQLTLYYRSNYTSKANSKKKGSDLWSPQGKGVVGDCMKAAKWHKPLVTGWISNGT